MTTLNTLTFALVANGALVLSTPTLYAAQAQHTKQTQKTHHHHKAAISKAHKAQLAEAAKKAKMAKKANTHQTTHANTVVSEAQSQQQIVSNAFNYRQNVQASVNPRTGTFSITQTDVTLPGINGLNLAIGTRFEENNMTNHFHIGEGWSYNFAYISTDTEDGDLHYLHTDSGQVFQIINQDGTLQLKDYGIKNMTISYANNSPFSGATWVLSMQDGSKEYFNNNGDLIAITNRFGNHITFAYSGPGMLSSITDTYGHKVTVTNTVNNGNGNITLTLPDQHTLTYTIINNHLTSKTDQLGDVTHFAYNSAEPNDISSISYPTGAQTVIHYHGSVDNAIPGLEGKVAYVSSLVQFPTGEENPQNAYTTTYNVQSNGNTNNYLGNPFDFPQGQDNQYDALMQETTQPNYTYSTTQTQAGVTTVSVYNHFHQLISQKIQSAVDDSKIRTTQYWYPIGADGANAQYPAISIENAPATYSMPTKETVTYYDPNVPGITRSVTTTTQYNDYGQTTQQQQTVMVNGKATTTTSTSTYFENNYGLPDTTSTTFTDGAGKQITQSTRNVLTDDGKNIGYTLQTYTGTDGKTYTAVTHNAYVTSGTFTGMPSAVSSYVIAGDGSNYLNAPAHVGLTSQGSTRYQSGVNADGIPTLTTTSTQTVTQYDGTTQTITTSSVMNENNGQDLQDTDGRGLVTHYQYDAIGRVTKVTNPDGTVYKLYYHYADPNAQSSNGQNTLTAVYPNDYNMQILYDGFGREVSANDNLSGAAYQPGVAMSWNILSQKRYNSKDQVIETLDGNGNATHYTYDHFGRLIKTTYPNGTIKHDVIDDGLNASVSYSTNAAGTVITPFSFTLYNNQQKPIDQYTIGYNTGASGIKDLPPIKTDSQADLIDSLLNAINPKQPYLTGPYVLHSSTRYDGAGRTIESTDPMGYSKYWYYDGLNQLSEMILPATTIASDTSSGNSIPTVKANEVVHYTYDNAGKNDKVVIGVCQTPNLLTGACSNSNPTDFPNRTLLQQTFNQAGELIQQTFGDGTTNQFKYDADGNMIWRKDEAGRVFTYQYQPTGNHLLTMNYQGKSLVRYAYYTPVGEGVTGEITPPQSQVKWVRNANATIHYTYDLKGRQTAMTYDIPATANTAAIQKTMTYNKYDGDNNVTSMTDFAGNTVLYGYNNMNQLLSVHDNTQYKIDGSMQNLNAGYVYNPNGTLQCKVIYTGAINTQLSC